MFSTGSACLFHVQRLGRAQSGVMIVLHQAYRRRPLRLKGRGTGGTGEAVSVCLCGKLVLEPLDFGFEFRDPLFGFDFGADILLDADEIGELIALVEDGSD